MKKRITILLLMPFQVLFLAAQPAQINVRKIGNENGLFTSNITGLLQDSKGFLWVISFNKIQRYDGKYTKLFYTYEGGNAQLLGIAEDSYGNIWTTTSKYVYKYENEYTGFKKFSDTLNPVGEKIKMVADDHNRVFILCRKGILSVDEKNNTLKTLPVSFTIDNSSYFPFYSYKNWLFFSNQTMVYRYYLPDNKLDSVPFEAARQMAVVNEDGVWAGNTKLVSSLVTFSTKTVMPVSPKQFDKEFTSGDIFISESYPVSDNYLLTIVRYKGFFLYNKKNDSFKEIKVYDSGVELQNNEVWTNGLHKAKNGVNFLLLSNALYYVIPEDRNFGFFNPNGANPSTEVSSVIRNFAEDEDNNLWMASSNGFIKWNRSYGQVKNYYAKPKAKDYLNFSSVRGIAFNKNKLLIGQSDGGIWIFDPVTEKFIRPHFPLGIYGDSVRRWTEKDFISSIYPLRKGDYLVASNNYIKRISGTNNSIDFIHFSGIKNIKFTRIIYEDRQNRLWFLGTDGIYVTDSAFKLIAHITNPKLNGSYLNAIEQVTDSTFWVGWEGLHEVTITKNDSLTIQPVFSNLDKLIIYNLFKDSAGYYWASSDDGIYRLQEDKKSYRLYDKENNVLSNQYSPARTFRGRDGNIFLPGYNGVTYFTPEKLSGSGDSLYTIITSVKINDNDSLFFLNKADHLNYNQNSIEINYIAPYVYNGTKVMYRYWLEGADKEWANTGSNTFVRFSSLADGNYKFRVAASLNGRDWFETSRPFIFEIEPPFWKTWWFRLFTVLIILSGTVLFFRKRINAVKTKARLKQQMTEMEVKALRAQMNPHFIFNAMNSIQQFTLKNDIDNANLYISKFSTLLRKVLQSSQQNYITLEEEIEQLKLYMDIEKIRLGKDFNYNIKIDDDVEMEAIKIPGMLIQPFVENAIKHGLLLKEGEKKLTVDFTLENDQTLIVTILDNGIGRVKAMQLKQQNEKFLPHESRGIQLVEERLKLLGHSTITGKPGLIQIEDCQDESGNATGTKIIVRLPLG